MKIDRRTFIKNTTIGTAGLAAFGVPGILTGNGRPYPIKRFRPLSRHQRLRLIEMARFGKKRPNRTRQGMVITSHPLATHEAVRVLKEGGNACDAALTASVTQTVVEPHMTAITGVLSMLYFDASTGKTLHMNGSNNRPLNGLDNFDPLKLREYLEDGKGVTTPGFWAGFEAASKRYGVLPKKRLVQPAIHYAREGFEVHPFLYGEVFAESRNVSKSAQGREIYMPNRRLIRPGEKVYQKRAADTLEQLADEGNNFFYYGDFAKHFSEVVQKNGGFITPEDFGAYEVMWQDAAMGTYRDYDVAGSPPPDFGGSTMIEILQMVELMDLQKTGPASESFETALKFLQILGEVLTSAYLVRQENKIPSLNKLLSKNYAKERFDKLEGKPKNLLDLFNQQVPPSGSNHVTVVDKDGNVATILHSIMSWPWSNGMFVDGVSIVAAGAHYGMGLPKPGERINARICPTIILKNGKAVLSSGSPSISLMQNILQNTTNVLDFDISIRESVNLPRFGGDSLDMPGGMIIEADMPEKIQKSLKELGVKLDLVNPWNWHHGSFEGIYIDDKGVRHACGDPRRNSHAEGY